MDGEGLVHDEKKGVTPFPKTKRKERANRKKRALKNLESRAIFTREIERSCAIFKGIGRIGRIVYRRGK